MNSQKNKANSTTAKKKYTWKKLVLPLLLSAAIIYGVNIYLPEQQDLAKTDFYYTNYEKAEATILETYGNGRIGKGQATMYNLQYTASNGEIIVTEYRQDTFLAKNKGDKIIIYYDPTDPYKNTSEERYLTEKKILEKQAKKKKAQQ